MAFAYAQKQTSAAEHGAEAPAHYQIRDLPGNETQESRQTRRDGRLRDGDKVSLRLVANQIGRFQVGYAQHLRATPAERHAVWPGTRHAGVSKRRTADAARWYCIIHVTTCSRRVKEDGATVAICYFEYWPARLGLSRRRSGREHRRGGGRADGTVKAEQATSRKPLRLRWRARGRRSPRGKVAADLVAALKNGGRLKAAKRW